MNDVQSTVVDYTIECHGRNGTLCDFSHSTFVSTQWIRMCLEVCFCDLTLISVYAFKVPGYLPVLTF